MVSLRNGGETVDVGLERLRAVLDSGEPRLEALADRIMDLSRDQTLKDDSALMLVSVPSTVADGSRNQST